VDKAGLRHSWQDFSGVDDLKPDSETRTVVDCLRQTWGTDKVCFVGPRCNDHHHGVSRERESQRMNMSSVVPFYVVGQPSGSKAIAMKDGW
jgi:hypothetical protein